MVLTVLLNHIRGHLGEAARLANRYVGGRMPAAIGSLPFVIMLNGVGDQRFTWTTASQSESIIAYMTLVPIRRGVTVRSLIGR